MKEGYLVPAGSGFLLLPSSVLPVPPELEVIHQVKLVPDSVPGVQLLVLLLPHVFLQYVSGLENLLTVETQQSLQFLFDQVEELPDIDEVVRLAHAEVMIEGHVVEELPMSGEDLPTEETAPGEGRVVPLLLLYGQHLQGDRCECRVMSGKGSLGGIIQLDKQDNPPPPPKKKKNPFWTL